MGGREPTWKALRLEGDTTQYNIAANDSNDGCEDAGERLLFIRQAVGKQTADHPSHYAAANEERDNVGGCHDAG
ncbi:MAG TPA: hypothetical protein VIG52_03760 [Methyloceanibacter sp.]|jgi:hypothetical protein